MKKKDVPQDNEGLHEGKFRDLCYAIDENGNYVTELSTGWSPKNAAMLQAWEEIESKVEETRQEVLKGLVSPLAYFMEKNIMDLDLLSQYAKISKRKIKRHLKPKIFDKLEDHILTKYANAFEIPLGHLRNFNRETR